jgi:hypothetical protein
VEIAVRDGIVVSFFIVVLQVIYRVYPGYFAPLAATGVVLVLFYRKLDRIEAALSDERRRAQFRRRQAARAWVVVFLGVTSVLAGVGSYAVWHWMPPVD